MAIRRGRGADFEGLQFCVYLPHHTKTAGGTATSARDRCRASRVAQPRVAGAYSQRSAP